MASSSPPSPPKDGMPTLTSAPAPTPAPAPAPTMAAVPEVVPRDAIMLYPAAWVTSEPPLEVFLRECFFACMAVLSEFREYIVLSDLRLLLGSLVQHHATEPLQNRVEAILVRVPPGFASMTMFVLDLRERLGMACLGAVAGVLDTHYTQHPLPLVGIPTYQKPRVRVYVGRALVVDLRSTELIPFQLSGHFSTCTIVCGTRRFKMACLALHMVARLLWSDHDARTALRASDPFGLDRLRQDEAHLWMTIFAGNGHPTTLWQLYHQCLPFVTNHRLGRWLQNRVVYHGGANGPALRYAPRAAPSVHGAPPPPGPVPVVRRDGATATTVAVAAAAASTTSTTGPTKPPTDGRDGHTPKKKVGRRFRRRRRTRLLPDTDSEDGSGSTSTPSGESTDARCRSAGCVLVRALLAFGVCVWRRRADCLETSHGDLVDRIKKLEHEQHETEVAHGRCQRQLEREQQQCAQGEQTRRKVQCELERTAAELRGAKAYVEELVRSNQTLREEVRALRAELKLEQQRTAAATAATAAATAAVATTALPKVNGSAPTPAATSSSARRRTRRKKRKKNASGEATYTINTPDDFVDKKERSKMDLQAWRRYGQALEQALSDQYWLSRTPPSTPPVQKTTDAHTASVKCIRELRAMKLGSAHGDYQRAHQRLEGVVTKVFEANNAVCRVLDDGAWRLERLNQQAGVSEVQPARAFLATMMRCLRERGVALDAISHQTWDPLLAGLYEVSVVSEGAEVSSEGLADSDAITEWWIGVVETRYADATAKTGTSIRDQEFCRRTMKWFLHESAFGSAAITLYVACPYFFTEERILSWPDHTLSLMLHTVSGILCVANLSMTWSDAMNVVVVTPDAAEGSGGAPAAFGAGAPDVGCMRSVGDMTLVVWRWYMFTELGAAIGVSSSEEGLSAGGFADPRHSDFVLLRSQLEHRYGKLPSCVHQADPAGKARYHRICSSLLYLYPPGRRVGAKPSDRSGQHEELRVWLSDLRGAATKLSKFAVPVLALQSFGGCVSTIKRIADIIEEPKRESGVQVRILHEEDNEDVDPVGELVWPASDLTGLM